MMKKFITIKFLLYCFEVLSGMKVNYHKSEVYALGVLDREAHHVADLFNCKLGSLPMTYLGLSVHHYKSSISDFRNLIHKVEKKLATWKCGYLSYGGRMVLINSCLNSLPLYCMSMFLLPESVHVQLD
ncbi:hypothetical protein GUJ93_ZPchr0002g26462 [Zizania palustris]|uniref:Reverse transcriptase n=1 Tax=Zizania palustris TaxID=103762 RepID=A0A8J5S2D7_ZIZPA|nr:hypothetical protein GUJ93_ZPchr0002g26462 [Zizania palustris]